MVIKLRADVCPYACENFRRLCEAPASEGGYVGSSIHEIKPTINFSAGVDVTSKKGKTFSRSAFGGTSFEDESDGELDHGSWCVGMASGKLLPSGQFGSEFYIAGSAVEEGSVKAAMMDQSDDHMVIGEVVDGFIVLEMLEGLMASRRWMNLQAQAGSTGAISSSTSPGGPPAVPVTIRSAVAIAWTKADQLRASRIAETRGSIRKGIFDQDTGDDEDNVFGLARSGALKHASLRLTPKPAEAPEERKPSAQDKAARKTAASAKFKTAPLHSSIGSIGKLAPAERVE